MAFGRRKSKEQQPVHEADAVGATPAESSVVDDLDGPFDIEDFDESAIATEGRLDLGSVLVPLPESAQLQVELTEVGVPSAVWVVTANGRFTIAAYAAPKTGGLWREVAGELAESLRNEILSDNGKHTKWGCPCGKHITAVPRHGDISPGVVRNIMQKLACLPGGWLQ